MSKQVLDLLRAISFLEKDDSVPKLAAIPQDEIAKRLAYFYQSRKEGSKNELTKLFQAQLKNSALISGLSAANEVVPLCSKLLVCESVVVGDPLFDFAAPINEMSKVEQQGLGIRRRGLVGIAQLTETLSHYSALAPLIEAGFVHVIPLGLLHEAPEQIPLNFPQNRYRELVPPDAVEFVRQSVIVRPLERTAQHGLVALNEPNTRLKRHVCITFRGDEAAKLCSFYHFREFNIHKVNEEDRTVEFSYEVWSDEPLEKKQYDIWIEQSINQTIGARLEAISKEMRLADALNAPYLTESTFEAELLSRSGQTTNGNATGAINFLAANQHLLNLEDPTLIFQIRAEQSALLERFRHSLGAISEELKGLDSDEFNRRAQQLFEKEVQPQINEVNVAILKVQGSAEKGLLLTAGALTLALLSGVYLSFGAILVLAAAGVAGEALPSIGHYQHLRKQPQFIWHKLKA